MKGKIKRTNDYFAFCQNTFYYESHENDKSNKINIIKEEQFDQFNLDKYKNTQS